MPESCSKPTKRVLLKGRSTYTEEELRRKEMKNLQASLATSPFVITCGITKCIRAIGGVQGGNP